MNILNYIYTCYLLHVLIKGFHNIQNGSTIAITKADINASFRHSSSLFVWIFNTTTESRIQFTFSKFGFYWSSNYHSSLEIGDGLVPGDSSRLAVFRGLDLPSGVMSVSSSAWLSIQEPRQGGRYLATRLTSKIWPCMTLKWVREALSISSSNVIMLTEDSILGLFNNWRHCKTWYQQQAIAKWEAKCNPLEQTRFGGNTGVRELHVNISEIPNFGECPILC